MNAGVASLDARRRRELCASLRIPYTAHVTPYLVRTKSGDFVQVFRLGGASFESADDETLNQWHERLNLLWRNIASSQVALWVHTLRRRERMMVPDAAGAGFAERLSRRYRLRLAGEALMVNELYLSIVYRPAAGVTAGLAAHLLMRSATQEGESVQEAAESCEKLAQWVETSLERYEPERLTTADSGDREQRFRVIVNADVRQAKCKGWMLAQAFTVA